MTVPALALVLARARNGVIGKDGTLPWRISEDLAHFKRITMGHALIMGRKTYESIGRPLPGRRNIVVSRTPGAAFAGCEVASSVEAAIDLARTTDTEPCVIGGAAIYDAALPLATTVYLTEIDEDVTGDVVVAPFSPAEWEEVERRAGATPGVSFVTLRRR